jgi:hypothetical protein
VGGPTPAATARRIGSVLPPLRSARRDLPMQLTGALDRALAPDPSDRGELEQLRAALALALELLWREPAPRARRSRSRPRTQHEPRTQHGPRTQHEPWPEHEPVLAPEPLSSRQHATALGTAAPGRSAGWREPKDRRAGAPAARDRRGIAGLTPGPSAAHERRDATAEEARRARALGPPRGLWVGLAVAVIAWQAWSGRPGVSLLLAAAVAPLALLPPRTAERPSAALGAGPFALAGALAPLLGVVGLASAFPAVAGQGARWRARAVAGALGYWWLTLSEPLLGRRLWLGPPAKMPPRAAWEGSITSSAAHVLAPLLSFGVLLGVLLWAAGAVSLPWLVRGRRAALDVIAVSTWSAGLAAAAPLVDRGLASAAAHANPRGLVLGAVLGALLAVAARAVRGPV